MMFGQLSNRNSLRDSLVCINAHQLKHYHLGLGKSISRSNLAEANEKRDYRIFELLAYEMIAEARKCCMPDSDFNLSIQGNVYAFDARVIDLCLNVFWWATFRKTKAAIKLHTLLDVKTSLPVFVHITAGFLIIPRPSTKQKFHIVLTNAIEIEAIAPYQNAPKPNW